MNKKIDKYDAIILGAGGAGMMCAAVAGQRGKKILLIDHADRPGKKILISGGGRCNFTNINATPEKYISQNKHFAKSALKRYSATDFINLVNSYNIAWHEKTLGQLFCNDSAKQIVSMLRDECEKGGVILSLGHNIADVSHADGLYTVQYGNRMANAPALVIATGGPSIPKMGASGFAYELGRKFGLKIVEPRPALVPFTLGGDQTLFRSLSGVAAEVVASCGKTKFREAALFTHKGLSGPSILQISSYWQHGDPVHINFLPDLPKHWLIEAKQHNPSERLPALIRSKLPKRLADTLVERLEIDGDMGNIKDKTLSQISEKLSKWEFNPNGTEGYEKAEVTIGGIDTKALSSQTMMASHLHGLYAIGEAVDVTGWLGGYNFQWAWASGWAAGHAL